MLRVPRWIWFVVFVVIVIWVLHRASQSPVAWNGLQELLQQHSQYPSPTKPHRTPPYPKESLGEAECRRVFETLFQKPFPRVRPEFLRNPLTGRLLELDGYNADLKLAFERNGKQHVQGSSLEDAEFLKQVRRDIIKLALADKAQVHVMSIPHTVPIKGIERYVREHLPTSAQKHLCE